MRNAFGFFGFQFFIIFLRVYLGGWKGVQSVSMLVQTDNGAYNLLEVVSRLFSVMPIVCFKVFFHFVLLAV